MHVISKKVFVDAAQKHPNQRRAILDLYSILKKGKFDSPEKMRHGSKSAVFSEHLA